MTEIDSLGLALSGAIVALPATDTPERVNAWMRDTFERVVVDMATPGTRGVTTNVTISPEWRNGLQATVADNDTTGDNARPTRRAQVVQRRVERVFYYCTYTHRGTLWT